MHLIIIKAKKAFKDKNFFVITRCSIVIIGSNVLEPRGL